MSGFTWAPVFACYGDNNRTNMLRIPMGGGRVECRAADTACNPYLGGALMLAAGLEGIREELDPGEPEPRQPLPGHRGRTWWRVESVGCRGHLARRSTPSRLIRWFGQVFGDEMFESFVTEKRAEWDGYNAHVSAWETERYLRFW